MTCMSTVEHAASATAMIVESKIVAEALLDEQMRIEPYVVLERDSGRTRVRKLTPAEKVAHSESTGESAFLADEREQEAFFALLARQAEG